MKKGTTVKLNASSSIGDLIFKDDLNDKYNPLDCQGVIIQIGNHKVESNPVIVRWDNGYQNSYEWRNLIEL